MCKVFYYKKFNFLPETGILTLTYGIDDNHTFTETMVFPGAPFALSSGKELALNQIFRLLHVAAGISYYKAFLPPEIRIEGDGLTESEAAFFNHFYLSGLGEFAVRNHLNLQGRIDFPADSSVRRTPVRLRLPYNALIPVGGGKDSCVTTELIKQTDLPAMTIAMGCPRPIRDCMDISGLPSVCLSRELDSHLLELNQTGTVYNGHVPITGILAFVLWAAAILYDKKYVVMSCERSADSGNMTQGDLVINHQYSKSFAFERDFYALTQTITPEFRYFSLLRPLSEAHIGQLFSRLCTAYFPAFTSCNRAFRLDKTKRLDRWCGTCDKCRFVFLILAPFLERDTWIHLMGCNPLNDDEQIGGYRELLGLTGHKPFECVGELDESRWAFGCLAQRPEWQNDVVIRALADQVSVPDGTLIFQPSGSHLIPEELTHVLEKFR